MYFSSNCKQDNLGNLIAYICNYEYEYFLKKANVVGICLGYKIKGGFYTNKLCIKVFVSKKIPINRINSNDLIPSIYKRILTDVVETGVFRTNSLTARIRPTIGGYGIGNDFQLMSTGTLGCLVTNKNDCYILSCNHVLANNNKAPIGTKIIQPSYAYGGKLQTDVIAILSKIIPKKPIATLRKPTNYSDCAIAKVINKSLVSSEIALVGIPQEPIVPRLNQVVKKVGAISELTMGMITGINATIEIESISARKIFLFKEQIITTKVGNSGDSGALLLDIHKRTLGLLMAAGSSQSVSNPINYILKELGVRLVTS